MNETKAVIHEAFYDFIRDAKSLNKLRKNDRRSIEDTRTFDADEVYQRISQIIPKVYTHNTSIQSLSLRFAHQYHIS